MFDTKQLDDLARRLSEALPPGLRDMSQDLEKNFRAVLLAAFSRMDLVTRDEFDRQAEMLARTRGRLEALEDRVARLEGGDKGPAAG